MSNETNHNRLYTWPEKAYKNLDFLTSPSARTVRVLCEFLEPQERFRKKRVKSTVVFFGSARTQSPEAAERALKSIRAEMGRVKQPGKDLKAAYERAKRAKKISRYYDEAMQLSGKLTDWAMSLPNRSSRFVVCSGGGPGIMEAVNRGALEAGGPSIGFNISLPMEQMPNPYQTPELSFEFHYFFVRKFWFVYLAQALIVFPGGFGTFDELFTLLTLVQTGKTARRFPIILYGSEYWKQVVNFDAMVDWGVISPDDLKLFRFMDTVDDAFSYLKAELMKNGHNHGRSSKG